MQLFKWFLMLNKRLYKKITFLILMGLIPVSILILMFAAQGESGFLKIVLAQEDPSDPISSAIIEDFVNEKSLIIFSQADTSQKALELVSSGQADVAWLLPEDLEEKIQVYGAGESRKALVTVIEREQTVFSRISREKLTAKLVQYGAPYRYIGFIRKNISELDSVSDEKLMEAFENVSVSEEWFAFDNADSDAPTAAQSNYLLSPIRGLLAVLICLGGAAAVMLYMQDEKRGTFSLVKDKHRWLVAFACVLIALLNLAVVVLVALFIVGLAVGVLKELLGIVLYSICCALFCLLLKELARSIRAYSVILPLLAIAMCAICPVFFDFKKFALLAHLFPPTYYTNLLYNSLYLLYMPLYSLGVMALIALIRIKTGDLRLRQYFKKGETL